MIKVMLSNGHMMTVDDGFQMSMENGTLTVVDSNYKIAGFAANPIAAYYAEECEEDIREAPVTPDTTKAHVLYGKVFLWAAFGLGLVALFAFGYGIGSLFTGSEL